MEIRKEQRGQMPLEVEEIGLGKWHVRWNIVKVIEDEGIESYSYNEVEIDHKPTATEVKNIKALK